MDPGGIEPPIPPCHGGVLPVYYGPGPATRSPKGGVGWTVAESNRRPHPCEGYALPAELTAHGRYFTSKHQWGQFGRRSYGLQNEDGFRLTSRLSPSDRFGPLF